jgi:metal-responsive CopG/Arc/MetJ family transcriptional regulator
MARLKTITIKVPASLSTKVARLAKKSGVTRSEVIRDALEAYTGDVRPSFTESAGEFCGVAKGPGDLSTNPRHLKDFGK